MNAYIIFVFLQEGLAVKDKWVHQVFFLPIFFLIVDLWF